MGPLDRDTQLLLSPKVTRHRAEYVNVLHSTILKQKKTLGKRKQNSKILTATLEKTKLETEEAKRHQMLSKTTDVKKEKAMKEEQQLEKNKTTKDN